MSFALALLVVLSSLTTISGGIYRAGPSETWTILVYMNGDCEDLERFMIGDFNELETVGSSEFVKIIVQIDRRPGEDSSNGNWNDTRRYLVEEDSDPQVLHSTRLDDPPLGELNMGDPETFSDFLEFGFYQYPADRYMVSVGGHSDGVTGGVCEDITSSNSEMTLEEFSQAFRSSVDQHLSGPIDVLSLDVCRMGMAEAAAEVMDHADFMVAAFDDTPGAGWPYDLCVPPLLDGELTMEDRLNGVVNGFMEGYDTEGEFSYASLAAIDLNGFKENFLPAWGNLSEDMFYDAYDGRMIYSAARNSADRTKEDPSKIDSYHFASLLTTYSRLDTRVRQSAEMLSDTLNEVIVHSRTGSGHHPDSKAFGVNFPTSGVRQSYLDSEFSSLTPWDEFLNTFVNEIDANPVRINWSENNPGEVRFELISGTPSNIQFVYVEIDDGSGGEEFNLAGSGGRYYSDYSTEGETELAYRYRVRTVFGDDIHYPPDGYSLVGFTREENPPEIWHSPPSVVDISGTGNGLEFHLRDDTGVDLSTSVFHYRSLDEESWYSVPLQPSNYESFRGWLKCRASPDWIEPGIAFQYYLEVDDLYGNGVRAPDSGYWQATLGSGNRFYIDAYHSKLGDYSKFMKNMNASGLTLDLIDMNIDGNVLEGYKVYVLMSPSEPITSEEADSILGFMEKGGEVLLIMDPSDGVQRIASEKLLTELGLEPIREGIHDYYPYDPGSELGKGLPAVVGDVDWSFGIDDRSYPVYYTKNSGVAMGTQWLGYGRMVFSVSDLFRNGVMDRGSNQQLSGMVTGYLSENMRPILQYNLDPPAVVKVGSPLTIDMSSSTDPDGEILTYSVLISGNEFIEGPDPVINYTFSKSGVFPAVLTVTDGEGGESSVTISLESNRPPSDGIGVTKTEVHAGEEILFDYKGSDPDGDDVTVLWDLDDGSVKTGKTISHAYRIKGLYEVEITVRDSAGMEITMNQNILVKNSDPEAVIDRETVQVNKGPPRYTGDMMVTLEVKEGDLVFLSGHLTTDADKGDDLNYTWSVENEVIGQGVVLEHRFRESGLHIVNLTVHDGDGGVGQDALSVIVFNNPPTAFAEAKVDGNRVSFDAGSSSDDPWDDDLVYHWDFGDGKEERTDDPQVDHNYRFGGDYTVNLTVIDPDGDKGYYQLKVEPDGMRFFDYVVIALAILVLFGIAVVGFIIYNKRRPAEEDVRVQGFSGVKKAHEETGEVRGFSHQEEDHKARSINDLAGSKD